MSLRTRTRLFTALALLAIATTAVAGEAPVAINGKPASGSGKALPPNVQWQTNSTVDIVGGTDHVESDLALAKGNSYRVDTSVTLNEAEFFLDFGNLQALVFYVFEGATEFGSYSEVYRSSRTISGTGPDWYSTGPISVPMTAGKHYIIAVSWDGSLLYSYNIGDSQPTSFGACTHGYALGTNPLPATIDSEINDLAIYFQRLTTNEPSVPTVATTWSRVKKLVN